MQDRLVCFARFSWPFLTHISRSYLSGSAVASSMILTKSFSSKLIPSCKMKKTQQHASNGRKPSSSARLICVSSKIACLEWAAMASSWSLTRSRSQFQSFCANTSNQSSPSASLSKSFVSSSQRIKERFSPCHCQRTFTPATRKDALNLSTIHTRRKTRLALTWQAKI